MQRASRARNEVTFGSTFRMAYQSFSGFAAAICTSQNEAGDQESKATSAASPRSKFNGPFDDLIRRALCVHMSHTSADVGFRGPKSSVWPERRCGPDQLRLDVRRAGWPLPS
jgi:hypothetical protein